VKTSVIIPALNEEDSIALVLGDLPDRGIEEVIVVDNGSDDATAARAAAGGARVVAEPRRGYGSACLRGIASLAPDCEVVVFLDADHSDHGEELPRLVEPIRAGRAELVIGSRSLGRAEPGALLPQARFGNRLACFLMRLLYGHRFTDLGPFRAITREALTRIGMRDPDFGWTVEMQIKALRAGLRVAEVPVSYRRRRGRSKITGTFRGTLAAGTKILWTIFRYGVLQRAPRPAPPDSGP
jgi:glycosyltransferase involved in cell wall biosynthesis